VVLSSASKSQRQRYSFPQPINDTKMVSYKLRRKVVQYMALVTTVVVSVAVISTLSDYQGFLHLNINFEGITLVVDGR
jgi:hypothetical protein